MDDIDDEHAVPHARDVQLNKDMIESHPNIDNDDPQKVPPTHRW
jgi:hypothetical protein